MPPPCARGRLEGFMSRWTTYDEAAAKTLAQRFGNDNVQQQNGNQEAVLSAVLAADGAAVALLPARHGETVVVTRRPLRATRVEVEPPCAFEATGFLGLHDEPIYDDEPVKPKSWWERFW